MLQIIFPTFGWPDILPARPGIAHMTSSYLNDQVTPGVIESNLGESHENCSNNSQISPRMIGSYLHEVLPGLLGLTCVHQSWELVHWTDCYIPTHWLTMDHTVETQHNCTWMWNNPTHSTVPTAMDCEYTLLYQMQRFTSHKDTVINTITQIDARTNTKACHKLQNGHRNH